MLKKLYISSLGSQATCVLSDSKTKLVSTIDAGMPKATAFGKILPE